MKISLKIINKKNGFSIDDYIEFRIVSTYAPTNLWVVKSISIKNDGAVVYKKVIAVMEAVANIDGRDFHGRIISVVSDDNELLNLVVWLGEENNSYDWEQTDNDFIAARFVDIDEIRSKEEFRDLSIQECFERTFLENIAFSPIIIN